MNNPTKLSLDLSSKTTSQASHALRAAVLTLGAIVLYSLIVFYLALQNQVLFVHAGGLVIFGLSTIMALVLTRRGRSTLGMSLMLGGLYIAGLSGTLTIADFGVVVGFIMVCLTMGVAALALPQKLAGRMIGVGIVVGLANLLLELYVPLAYRAEEPVIPTAALAISAILVLIYVVFIVRQFANYRLRTKLIISFVTVGILAAGTVAFFNVRDTQTKLTDAANQTLLTAASQTATRLDDFITTNLDAVRIEAQLVDLVELLSLSADQRSDGPQAERVQATLRSLSRRNPIYISSYALLDRQGVDVVDTYLPDIGLDKSKHDYFQGPLKTGLPYVSPIEISATTHEPSFYFSSPVRNAAGEIIGVLRVRYNAGVLQEFIVQHNELAGPRSYAILLDENRIYMAHGVAPNLILKTVGSLDPARAAELQAAGRLPDRPLTELSIDLPALKAALANPAAQILFTGEIGEEGVDVDDGGGDVEQAAITTLSTQPWRVVFVQPQEVFLAPIEGQTRSSVVLVVLIATVVAAVAVGLGQFLARPISRLTSVAQQIAAGDLTVQATVETQDEIGQLAEAFNSMTAQIRGLISSLEDQVRERTAELVLSMKVGQRALAIRDLAELLPTITEFIRNRFNLYYTQILFVDDLGQNLVLTAGTGAMGAELLARRHSLPVGPGSLVGRVAAEERGMVVSDTNNSDFHQDNPLLSETRSELAVPLIVGGRVIGVLNMQANRANTFTEQNLIVFEAMATQLANAIDSARQWALGQEAQRKSEDAIRQLTRQSWIERLASHRGNLGFTYDLSAVTPLSDFGFQTEWPVEAISDFGLEHDNGESKIQNPKSKMENRLAVSVVIQNESIGQLAVEMPPERAISLDEQNLLAAVAEQLGQKAENLRLFEQTQQRAAREQITRQITDKVRASRDIESALKIAAEELAKSLGVARVVVDLRAVPESHPANKSVGE